MFVRQKQATSEARKLNAIKKELSVLEQMLTADVSVIRNRIEEATREYTEARYISLHFTTSYIDYQVASYTVCVCQPHKSIMCGTNLY